MGTRTGRRSRLTVALAGLAVLTAAATTVVGGPATAGAGAASAKHEDLREVVSTSFPDPGFLLTNDGHYYLYATGPQFPVRTSTKPASDYISAGATGKALRTQPAWAVSTEDGGHRWAPHVFVAGSRYVMYFTATKKKISNNEFHDCIGVATSAQPSGNFDAASTPLYCTAGTTTTLIDPTQFQLTDGTRYLVYKQRTFGKPGNYEIRGIQVTADGTRVMAKAVPFTLYNGGSQIVEAPSLIQHGNSFWLFVSRNQFLTCGYDTQVLSAKSFRGPYHPQGTLKLTNKSNKAFCGPGGAEVIKDGSTTRIAFAVWKNGISKAQDPSHATRVVYTGPLVWTSGRPTVQLVG